MILSLGYLVVFFFPPFFHLHLPRKPPASLPRTVAKGLEHPSQPRRGMSAIPAVGGRKPGDSWGSYLTWVSGEAELAATISFG